MINDEQKQKRKELAKAILDELEKKGRLGGQPSGLLLGLFLTLIAVAFGFWYFCGH